MATTNQIVQFVLDNTTPDILRKAIQQNMSQSEIEFALRIKEVQMMELIAKRRII